MSWLVRGVEFSTDRPMLAFPNRTDYDEYVLPGLWADADPFDPAFTLGPL